MATQRKRTEVAKRPRQRKLAVILPVPFGTVVEEDPAAEFDELQYSLERAKVPAGGRLERPGKRAKAFQDVDLVTIDGASDFKSDPVLSDNGLFMEELLRHDLMEELLEQMRCASDVGRKRGKGEWFALFMYMVNGGISSPYALLHSEARRTGPSICRFGDWIPCPSVTAERFEELELKWELVAEAVGRLERIAYAAVPEMGDVLFVDSTIGRSPSRLEHCCTDLDACAKAGKIGGKFGGSAFVKGLGEARKEEAELPESELPKNVRTRQVVVEVDDHSKRGPQRYRLFFIKGHWYRSLDLTSGFRRYGNGVMWHGSYHQFAVTPVTWSPVAGHSFRCDIQEWDGYPKLLEMAERLTGRRPYLVSTDRGFSISDCYEYNLRRDIVLIAPRRGINDKNPRINLRHPEFDEHGVPRCRHCGGVGLIDLPGLGLERRGRDPRIAFVCAAPFFPECTSRQVIDPSLRWDTIGALSRFSELYHAARYWRNPSEGVHRQIRWNYLVAPKDVGSRTFRTGIPAQRLRMWTALLITWWKLLLRHGWIKAKGLDVTINDSRLVRLSGEQDRRTGRIITPGHGTERLGRLLAERDDNNTDLPYGAAAERTRARVRRELGLGKAA